MIERWVGAAVLEVSRGFRRIRGYRDFKRFANALNAQHVRSAQRNERKIA